MSFKKIIFFISFLAVFGFLFNFNAPTAKAITVAEIQVLIQQLQAQIAQLQQQLAGAEGGKEVVWCHDFNISLRYGDAGTEVEALQIALEKEGLYTIFEGQAFAQFDERLASAVVGFQEKYKEDILGPWGLTHGTGYVGGTTRAKLNELYGCKEEVEKELGAPTLISPKNNSDVYTLTPSLRWNTVSGANWYGVVVLEGSIVIASIESSPPQTTPIHLTGKLAWGQEYHWKVIACEKIEVDLTHPNWLNASSVPGCGSWSNTWSFTTVKLKPLWTWDYCSPTNLCNAGEGDCDTDLDCATGYCALDVGIKYGQVSTMDVCEERATITPSISYISPIKGPQDTDVLNMTIKGVNFTGAANFSGCGISPISDRGLRLLSCRVISNTEIEAKFSISATATLGLRYISVQTPTGGVSNKVTFTVTSVTTTPSITVTSPNGGEQWEIDKTYTITWKHNLAGNFEAWIHLLKGGAYYGSIAGEDIRLSNAQNLTSYSWRVGDMKGGVGAGNDYQVRITYNDVNTGVMLTDTSDNYFSIVAKEKPGLWTWDYCTPTNLCSAGQGDCDTDADCNTGYCAQNVGTKYGQSSSMDVCEVKEGVTPSITVTSPNGGEKWQAGNTVTIKWNAQGIDKINIDLGYANGDLGTITSGLSASQGYYQWYIPSSIEGKTIDPRNDYRIIIRKPAPDYTLLAQSNNFSIGVSAVTTPSITITYPTSGEVLQKGTNTFINLQFSPSVPKGGFVVNLLRSDTDIAVAHLKYCGTTGYTQDSAMPINVSWAWKVGYAADGKEIPNGSYRIFVYDCGDKTDSVWTGSTASAKSNVFSIVSATVTPSVTVLSPNGGEQWETGETHTIKWTSAGYNSSASIQIGLRDTRYDPNLAKGEMTIANTTNSGSYNWTIPSTIEAGSFFKVVVYIEGGEAGKYDLSNNHFQITQAVACSDSDGGKDYYTKGTVTDDGKTYTDYCYGAFSIKEYFCLQTSSLGLGGVAEEVYVCPNNQSCQNGACLKETVKSITVVSPNGGESLQEGSNYKISWNALNLPSDAKITITLFRNDEQNMRIISNLPSTQREYVWWVTGSGDWGFGYEYKPSLFAKILGIKEVEAAGYSYQIMVSALWGTYGTNYYGNVYDKSNGWFYINPSTVACTDSDGGKDYYTKGKGTGLYGSNKQTGVIWGEDPNKCSVRWDNSLNYTIHYDCCSDSQTSNQLNEGYCDSSGLLQTYGYQCPYGCENGVCITRGGSGLKNIENQLASISEAISQLMEKIKELMRR